MIKFKESHAYCTVIIVNCVCNNDVFLTLTPLSLEFSNMMYLLLRCFRFFHVDYIIIGDHNEATERRYVQKTQQQYLYKRIAEYGCLDHTLA